MFNFEKRLDKLEKRQVDSSFKENYKGLNITAFWASIFGNLANICITWAIVYFLIGNTIEASNEIIKTLISGGLTAIFLVIFELLKRFVLYEAVITSFEIGWNKGKSVGYILASLLIVGMSVFGAVKGYDKLTSKTEVIEVKVTSDKDAELKAVDDKYSKDKKLLAASKETQLNDPRNNWRLSKLAKEYMELEANLDKKIADDKAPIIAKYANTQVKEVTKNENFAFIGLIITLFIESWIFLGIWYNGYYEWHCVLEKVNGKDKDKTLYYNRIVAILKIVYDNYLAGVPIKPIDYIYEMATMVDKSYTKEEIERYLAMFKTLDILVENYKAYYFRSMSLTEADNLLKKYCRI